MKIAISSSELLLEVRCIKALSDLLVLGVGVVQMQSLSWYRESPSSTGSCHCSVLQRQLPQTKIQAKLKYKSHPTAVSCISDLRITWTPWPNTVGLTDVCFGYLFFSPCLVFCWVWSCQENTVACCMCSCIEEIFWANACTKCLLVVCNCFCERIQVFTIVQKTLFCWFSSLWQSCSVGFLATLSFLSFIINDSFC